MHSYNKNQKPRFRKLGSSYDNNYIDRGLIVGLVLSFVLLVGAALSSSSFLRYLDFRSFVLVLGGCLAVGLISFSGADLLFTIKRIVQVGCSSLESPHARIALFGKFAHLVRANGLMALETESRRFSDPFLRRALELAADASSEKDLVRILETERFAFADRERRAIEVLDTLGNFSPAIGLIGTLLGLVEMMSLLETPQAIGPAMAMALLTTLYGAVLANIIFLPFAAKLRLRSEEETLLRSLTIEASVSLLKSENPTLLEQRLETFLPAFSESRKVA